MSRQPNLNSEEFYAILGCPRNATDAELKKAYRKLAVKWHPDKNPGNEQATKNFQKISEAYATLSDSKKRQLYNQYGKQGADAADQMPSGGGGMPGGMHFGGGMSPDDAQRLFSSFFGGHDPFGGGGGDPFGGGGGGMFSSMSGGGPGVSQVFMTTSGGGPGGSFSGMPGGGDPFSMMFGGGGGGGMPSGFSSSLRQQQSQPKPKPRYTAIPNGTVISLKGLINNPTRNGDRGVIQDYNEVSKRYVVQIEDSADTMSIKPSNIFQHLQVTICNIQSQPEVNGKEGIIMSFDDSKQRYNVYSTRLEKILSLKKSNFILPNGSVTQITGLQSKEELNGKFGTIKAYTNNKYDVQLSESQIIRVKMENVHV